MSRVNGFIRIIRPVNSLMMGVSVLVGAVMVGGVKGTGLDWDLALAFITGFTLSGAAMTINDYYDMDVDAINEPGRPIPSGLVKPREAVAYTFLLSAVGLYASWLVSWQTLGIAIFAWAVLMAYSSWGKRTGFFGNLMVSTCIALPFIYGGVMVSNSSPSLLFSLLAFLTNTGREITKGIIDMEGDRVEGIRTIAVRWGARTASRVAALFYMASVTISIIPIYFGLVSIWYSPFVALTDMGLLYEALTIVRDPSRENSRRVKKRILYWMLFGLLGFAAGSLL
jgi:geranylgeranylglycerol-phosphate geranylgeranyltransferase